MSAIDPIPANPAEPRPGIKRFFLSSAAAVAAGLVLIIGLILWANVPENVSLRIGEKHWLEPHDGYTFVDENDPFNWKVKWTSGKLSTTRAAMLAADTPDTWKLAPGYAAAEAGGNPVWMPSKREPDYPNVAAGTEPGTWVADPAYYVTGSAIAPTVTWRAGVHLPHMQSAERVNSWSFDEGYTFTADSTVQSPKASWAPGTRRSDNPHVYASQEEGKFRPDAGYDWLSDDVKDYRTFSIDKTASALNDATYIDGLSIAPDCENASILAAVESARDRYSALLTNEAHPAVTQHLANVHDTLTSGATMINTCFIVDVAPGVVDLGAAAYCAFFSKNSYDRCIAEYTNTWRDPVRAGGELGNAACRSANAEFWKRLDELYEERRELHRIFASKYRLQLATPRYIVSCRR